MSKHVKLSREEWYAERLGGFRSRGKRRFLKTQVRRRVRHTDRAEISDALRNIDTRRDDS